MVETLHADLHAGSARPTTPASAAWAGARRCEILGGDVLGALGAHGAYPILNGPLRP